MCINRRFMCIYKKKDTNLFGLPHLQHRHASNYGVGIFLCCRIYCVIGSNNKCQVCLCGPDIYTKQIITKKRSQNAQQLFGMLLLGSPDTTLLSVRHKQNHVSHAASLVSMKTKLLP